LEIFYLKKCDYLWPSSGEVNVASILPFIRKVGAVFDDSVTQIMGEAFDDACKELHDTGQPPIVYEVIAKRIIDRQEWRARSGPIAQCGLSGFWIRRGRQTGKLALLHTHSSRPKRRCVVWRGLPQRLSSITKTAPSRATSVPKRTRICSTASRFLLILSKRLSVDRGNY
jgi:hypothetical protein